MSSPCDRKVIKLRERNRILLDQLESNSILLERRLKELKHTARAARCSEKSRRNLPVSPLKRKYESNSWKARNCSEQVAAAVNARIYTLSSSSSNSQEPNVKFKQKVEDITSPAKRSKQNAQLGSRPRSKEELPCEGCQCDLKSSTTVDVRNGEKDCEDCYCKKDADTDTTNSDIASQESEGSMSPIHIGSNIHEDKEPEVLHSSKSNRKNGITENEQLRSTLEVARSIIDYSPVSIFLQRLKERSHAVGNKVASENIKRTLAKPSHVAPPRYSLYSDKNTVETKHTKPTKQSPVKTVHNKRSPLKIPHSSRSSSDQDGHLLITDQSQQSTTKRSPHRSLRRAYDDELKRKKNKRRVCYRKNCHCRVQENVRSTENFPSVVKDKAEAELGKEGCTSPGTSSSSHCECCCNRNVRQIHIPKPPLIRGDILAGLVDNEDDNRFVKLQGCERCSWLDELNEFRQSHWYDCHAYPRESYMMSRDATRNLDRWSDHPTSHKCVHKYALDDRLFARPLYSDHLSNSRCMECHLPYNAPKSKLRETPLITLPSSLQDPEIQVSIPLAIPEGRGPLASPEGRRPLVTPEDRRPLVTSEGRRPFTSPEGRRSVASPEGRRPLATPEGRGPSASGSVSPHKMMTHPSGRVRATSNPTPQPNDFIRTIGDLKSRAPAPADSLALRYQKGVAK